MAQASGPIAGPKDLPSPRPGPRARATYACGSLVYFMVRPPLRASRIKNNPYRLHVVRCVTPTRRRATSSPRISARSEEHTSELQSHSDLVCRLLLEKKKKQIEGIAQHTLSTIPSA